MKKENEANRKAGSVQVLQLHLGDCVDFMRSLPEGGIGSICTDPPYG